MKQETESTNLAPERNRNSNTPRRHSEVTPAPQAKSDDVTIKFHSVEFNRIDDLNDSAGNYRSFETLDGVVTAHERRQMEFHRERDSLDLPRNGPPCLRKSKVKKDDSETLEAAAPLTVISEGRTLIVDTDAERAMKCGKALRNHRLDCTLLIAGSILSNTSVHRLGWVKLLHVDNVSVTGAFGGFSAKVTVGGSEKPLTEWFDDATVFDLVLDLQPVASFAGGRLPVGYYAPGPSSTTIEEAMAELPEMRGQFKKPQFVVFHKNRCFHGRSHTHDCNRCLELCPVGAIRSVNRGILINHYLCQGCGGCALVCPADAFRIVQPPQEELLKSLQRSLESRSAAGISPMSLVISDGAWVASNRFPGTDEPDHDRRIFFEVAQIAYVRMEALLAALAYGARDVLVGCDSQNPPPIREAVEWQVKMARAILQGLGLEEERIRFLVVSPKDSDLTKAVPRPASIDKQPRNAPTMPTTFSPGRGGRALVHLAARYLQEQSGVHQLWLPLPTGSPFGTVVVNSDACTLCTVCVAACPSGALSSAGNAPRLVFREFQCHQCGLCRETCPEGAIQLEPRLHLEEPTEGQTVLREAEFFRCVECGVPFAPPAMINRIKEKLVGHWMYASERQLRRLQMCRTCRTRDALISGKMGL